MKAISLLIASVFLLSFGAGVLAQETELPDPGLTPDSPFYFLERIAEGIGTFFTFGDIKKAERYTALATERLAEASAMEEVGKLKLVEKMLERYGNQLEKALSRAERADTKGEDTKELAKIVTENTYKHLIVLNKVLERVPEEAKPAIEQAMVVSVKGHEKAVEVLEMKGALSEVPEGASLPAEIPEEVRERIQMKAQEELEKEELEKEESELAQEEAPQDSKSLREQCIEEKGSSEGCEIFPLQNPKSFEAVEAFCLKLGAPPELCATVEAKCREVGVTTPGKCFLALLTPTIRRVPATEEQMEELRIRQETQRRIQEEMEVKETPSIKVPLGMSFVIINDDMQTSRGLPVNYGVLIRGAIVSNSPAALAGLKEGDIILELNDEIIAPINHLEDIMYRSEAGMASFKVLRGEEKIIIYIKLTKQGVTQE